MGKFDGILIATDLDGTLLRRDKSISSENRRAIEYFMSEGGIFTFMTGRMPFAVSAILEKISVNAPIGCGNGLAIYDTENNEILWKTCVDSSVLETARFVERGFDDIGIEITMHDKILCVRTNDSVLKHLSDERLEHIECAIDEFDGEIAKLLFAAPPKALDRMIEELEKTDFGEKYLLLRSDITYYEILPLGVGKGPLLVRLAEMLNIPMSRTIAFGDNDNDASMLSVAGLGIAVSNASKTAIDASDLVTVSNEEHALAKIISDIEMGLIRI
ncbi:MAG: HAD family phosphatase [Clostridia bacterium]|nr:HAD family phosphatase [Clostridia bacterium]